MKLHHIALLATLSTPLSFAFAQSSPTIPQDVKVTIQSEEDEFKRQKAFMIEDTGAKIEVLRTAHECAKAAETPQAFADCNKALREAILQSATKKNQ